MVTNREQAALWNGASGEAWVEAQDVLDRMFQPFEDLLAGEIAPGSRVLDVGCGTGATTLACARRAAACVGLDLSEPMIARARVRAEREGSRATFVCADAQTHAFAPASFDRIVSRFGVMFFDDPVAAFGNLRRAMAEGGDAILVAWRGPGDNAFMTAAERAAAPLLPSLPPRVPGAPGQFAFADPDRVRRILDDAGWRAIDVQPLDVVCTFPEADLVQYVTRLGPVARVLHELDAPARARAIDVVRAAFEPFVDGSEVRYTAACWRIAARA